MNWDQVEGKWKQYKGAIREKWGKLTDDDLDVIEGNREKLVGKIQQYYGASAEQAQKETDEFVRSLKADRAERRETDRRAKAHAAGRTH